MIDLNLIHYMEAELQRTPVQFRRYMYDRILWEDRMIGLVGPRGVGKSTMVEQYLLSLPDRTGWLYVSADNTYFSTHTLISLADDWEKENGKGLVIDEIHKYRGWSQELKQIYDTHPDLKIIFTGSSILDIHKGSADLSRRALMFSMQGCSFREFLALQKDLTVPAFTLEEILNHKVTFPSDIRPLPLFREYLKTGYYPFSSHPGYEIRLQQIINQTIEADIPIYAGMNASTAHKLKRLLVILSKSAPYKPNMTNLCTELKVSKNDLPDYLLYLETAGMIGQLRDDTGGLRGLGKVEKVFIDNPNLIYAMGAEDSNIGSIRETIFYNQMRVDNDVTSSKITDFRIGEHIFEIGGPSKGKKQLQGDKNGIVVKDDIEYGFGNIIPLWHFALTY